MSYDPKMIDFGGDAIVIAERELDASFNDDGGDRLHESLWAEYQQAGCPKNQKTWLRERLTQLFACVDQRPKWIESQSTPIWPFWNGRPMIFIHQFEVPQTDLTETLLSPSVMLYVFGTREVNEYGWEMKYRVIQQNHNLP